jgi:hypothetical protein
MAAWIAPVVGAALNIGGSFLGANQQNKEAREAASRANKAAKQDWRYQNRGIKERNKYNQESVDISRKNQDLQIQLAEQQAMDSWSYNMTIRDFQYNNQLQAYNQQNLQKEMQLNFNESAFNTAMQKQDNWLEEQMINFDFADLEVDTNWANGFTDFQLNKNALDIQQQGKRAANNFTMEKAQIDTLKGEGLARAKGQAGRTAGKNIQAAIAEGGLAQAEIAEDTFQAGRQYSNSSAINGQNLEKLSDELEITQRKIANGRVSAKNADKFMRRDLKLQKYQADMNAKAKVMLKPKLAPDLPMPPDLDLYKAEIQDAFIVEELPEPIKQTAQQTSPWPGALNALANGAASFAGNLGTNSVTPPPMNIPTGGAAAGANAIGNASFLPQPSYTYGAY